MTSFIFFKVHMPNNRAEIPSAFPGLSLKLSSDAAAFLLPLNAKFRYSSLPQMRTLPLQRPLIKKTAVRTAATIQPTGQESQIPSVPKRGEKI